MSLDRAKLRVVAAIDSVFEGIVEMLRLLLFRRLNVRAAEPGRILIFRIGAIGDVVAATPVLEAIRERFPKAYIALLTSPGNRDAPGAQELIRPGSLVDSLIVYHTSDIDTWEKRRRRIREIRAQQFDLFIELPNIIAPFRQVIQSMLTARLVGCRYAIGFQAAPSRRFPRAQALHIPFKTEAERLFDVVAPALALERNGAGRLTVEPSDYRFVNELLDRHGVSTVERLAVVHVSAKRPANRWFADRFAAVADAMQTRHGIRVIFTGAPGERELVEEVRSLMRTSALSFCGQLALLQMAALLERACLYLGNDTGPMHIAAVMGTPTVAIFSARDFPQQWRPYGDGHIVLRRDVPCSPCFLNVCDRGLTCLERISVEDVMQAVEQQLARTATLMGPPMNADQRR